MAINDNSIYPFYCLIMSSVIQTNSKLQFHDKNLITLYARSYKGYRMFKTNFLYVFKRMCCKFWIFYISCLTILSNSCMMMFLCLISKLIARQKDMTKQTSQPQRTVQRIVPGTVEPFRSMRIKPAATYIPWRLLYRRLSPVYNVLFDYPKNL